MIEIIILIAIVLLIAIMLFRLEKLIRLILRTNHLAKQNKSYKDMNDHTCIQCDLQ